MIAVVGGVYHEICMCPHWDETYGSGGRAVSAIVTLGGKAVLYAYADSQARDVIEARAGVEGFSKNLTTIQNSPRFSYHHSLEKPLIDNIGVIHSPIEVKADKLIRFGFIEGDSVVDANYAVYDPQSPNNPIPFHANNSKAQHLALVLNKSEAAILCNNFSGDAEELSKQLLSEHNAEVVVIKLGPLGALVSTQSKHTLVPAYQTTFVWKIGSGDTFVGSFGYYWMEKGLSPEDAAALASKATAYYCQNSGYGFATEKRLSKFDPSPIKPTERYKTGPKPKIYLAGPFFTLAQLWMIDEARKNLWEMGFEVFSPYHDVGNGIAAEVVPQDISAIHQCDLMLAIADGLDSGTVYEIGYARAIQKRVVVYSENEHEDDLKMMEGTDCQLCNDYVTSIYKCLWIATSL